MRKAGITATLRFGNTLLDIDLIINDKNLYQWSMPAFNRPHDSIDDAKDYIMKQAIFEKLDDTGVVFDNAIEVAFYVNKLELSEEKKEQIFLKILRYKNLYGKYRFYPDYLL